MKTKKAGERKRTVTVTVGPQTWAMLTEVAAKINEAGIYGRVTPTDVVGSWVAMSAQRGCDSFGVLVPTGWSHTFD
jgi:hypothetical protein